MRTILCNKAYRGIQGLCIVAHKGCTGNDGENTGADRATQGMFIRTGFLEPVVKESKVRYVISMT